MKKILIFSLAYFPKHVGGAEVAIKEITDRIPFSLYEFHMVTLRFDTSLPKTEKVGNVLVHRIGFGKKNPTMTELRSFPLHLNKLLFQFSAFLKALSLHKRYQYDGIWAMMAHSSGVPAALFKWRCSYVKYVLTLQEGDPPSHIQRKMMLVYPLFKRAFSSANIIQTISNFLAKWSKVMGATCPLVVIPNAVDVGHFSQTYPPEELSAIRKQLGCTDGDILLITTSRLVQKNALDDVIKSMAYLPPNIRFAVLGTGPDDKMLHSLVEKEGVRSRVVFLGQIEHADLPKYLQASDIFIRPSLSEGMGNSFIEAMASGLPVIATPVGGIVDFLRDEETGLFCEVRNPENIAQQVKRLTSDSNLRKRMVAQAKAMVEKHYDWNQVAKRMKKEVFDKVFQ